MGEVRSRQRVDPVRWATGELGMSPIDHEHEKVVADPVPPRFGGLEQAIHLALGEEIFRPIMRVGCRCGIALCAPTLPNSPVGHAPRLL